jgi:hypothetical protein
VRENNKPDIRWAVSIRWRYSFEICAAPEYLWQELSCFLRASKTLERFASRLPLFYFRYHPVLRPAQPRISGIVSGK